MAPDASFATLLCLLVHSWPPYLRAKTFLGFYGFYDTLMAFVGEVKDAAVKGNGWYDARASEYNVANDCELVVDSHGCH